MKLVLFALICSYLLLFALICSSTAQDFYVWNNSSGRSVPPTLWSGKGREKVWHFDPDRMEWFYSRAGAKYPEFNYASEGVKVTDIPC